MQNINYCNKKDSDQKVNDEYVGFHDIFKSWLVGPRYEIIRVVGKGSYGEVAEAIDKKCNNRKVAIKRLLNIFTDKSESGQPTTDIKRLYREIHILKNLNHPQVIQLLDVICPYLDNKHIDQFLDSNLVNSDIDLDIDNDNGDNEKETIFDIEGESNDVRVKRKSEEHYIDKKKLPNINRSSSFESIDLQDVYLVFEYVVSSSLSSS